MRASMTLGIVLVRSLLLISRILRRAFPVSALNVYTISHTRAAAEYHDISSRRTDEQHHYYYYYYLL